MRRKIVLWGANEKDEKILVALELLEKENVVNIYTFPETVATEEFYKAMADKWRNDEEIEFPAGFTKIERKLSITDSLLPDEIKVTSTDIVARAQAEWHVVVLSSKLYDLYKSELEELKDKIEGVTQYDNALWEELRTFWGKIQNQMNDRNLFREHGFSLKEKTNNLFDKLKEFKKTLENEYETQSKEYVAKFQTELQEIENKIDKGLGLNPIFEDLKKVQQRINEFKFTKKDRDDVWAKIDTAFKKLKEKRSGGNSGQGGGSGNYGLSGLENRYNGLVDAIAKMEKSVSFDNKDLEFETKRIANSDGQLETMLRQAKLNMINERLSSKSEKLADMHKTRAELEAKMEKEKKRMIKNEKNEKVEEAKETVKAKIAADIAVNLAATENLSDKLEQAANDISAKRKPKSDAIVPAAIATAVVADQVLEEIVVPESIEEVETDAPSVFEQLADSITNLVQDVQDTALAVAEVVGDKLEDAMEKAEDVIDELEDKVEEKIEALQGKKDDDDKSDKKSDTSKEEEE